VLPYNSLNSLLTRITRVSCPGSLTSMVTLPLCSRRIARPSFLLPGLREALRDRPAIEMYHASDGDRPTT
jgi:hypothetical protein